MKNTQKKKITRNYHLLTKVESGKCRRVTASIDVIRDLKQTLEAVRWRRRWPRGSWVETASSWRQIRILSFRRSGGEQRLFWFRFQLSNLTLFVDFPSIMATFREVRDLLAVACFEDIIDEDEFLLLRDLHTSKNLYFPYED